MRFLFTAVLAGRKSIRAVNLTPQVNFALLFGGFGQIIALDFYVDSGMAIITYATSAAAKAALLCLQSSEIIVEGASEILNVEFSDEDAKNRGSNVDERKRQDKADETVIKPVSVYMCNETTPNLPSENWATTGSGQFIGPEGSNFFVRNLPFHMSESEWATTGSGQLIGPEGSNLFVRNLPFHMSESEWATTGSGQLIGPEGSNLFVRNLPFHMSESDWATTGRGQLIGPERSNLFVGNIPFHVSESELAAHFAPYGRLLSVTIYVDLKTRRSKGFGMFCSLTSNLYLCHSISAHTAIFSSFSLGFVSYDNADAAAEAIKAMDGRMLYQRKLFVSLKRSKA